MGKSRRVFELAKELGVTSRDVIEKCKAEGVPNVTNHMSKLTASLQETIRAWFPESGAMGVKDGHPPKARREEAPKRGGHGVPAPENVSDPPGSENDR